MAHAQLHTNAAILKRPVPIKSLPVVGGVTPSCGCTSNLLPTFVPEVSLLAPLEATCGCNMPNCGCSQPIVEIPTYYAPAVEVPSCGCTSGLFSAGVELASCGCGKPSCGCNLSALGPLPSCGCGVPNCGCSIVEPPAFYYAPPTVTPCGAPNCDCGVYFSPLAPSCGCDVPTCGCGLSTCGCTLPPLPPVLGCTKYLRQVVVQPPFL
ncbi:uncharacterized protein ACR2FA_010887 [Aphomia sociella]